MGVVFEAWSPNRSKPVTEFCHMINLHIRELHMQWIFVLVDLFVLCLAILMILAQLIQHAIMPTPQMNPN